LLWDTFGSLFWIGASVGIGYIFANQLEMALAYFSQFGALMIILVGVSLTSYLLIKYLQRRRLIKELRIARITPEELFFRREAGEELMIVDLRHSLDLQSDPAVIPGAVHIDPEAFQKEDLNIPRDREIILYCT